MPSSDDINIYYVGLFDGLDPDGDCGAQPSFWLALPIVGYIDSGDFLFPNFDNDRGFGSGNRNIKHFSDIKMLGKLPFGGVYTIDGIIQFEPDKVIAPVGIIPEIRFKGKLPLANRKGVSGVPNTTTAYHNNTDSIVREPMADLLASLYVSQPPVGVSPTPYLAPSDVQNIVPMKKGYILRNLVYAITNESNPHCP